jgi:primary-amine oxidase
LLGTFRAFRVSEHLHFISYPFAFPSQTKINIDSLPAMSHPLSILSIEETNLARDVVKAAHPNVVIDFREIFLEEPPKAQLLEFLAIEHVGRLSPTTPRPPRLALCQYDVIGSDRIPQFHESVIDVVLQERVKHTVVGKEHHASLTL